MTRNGERRTPAILSARDARFDRLTIQIPYTIRLIEYTYRLSIHWGPTSPRLEPSKPNETTAAMALLAAWCLIGLVSGQSTLGWTWCMDGPLGTR